MSPARGICVHLVSYRRLRPLHALDGDGPPHVHLPPFMDAEATVGGVDERWTFSGTAAGLCGRTCKVSGFEFQRQASCQVRGVRYLQA